MTMVTVPNPDLVVTEGNMSRVTCADHRRHGFHNLHTLARYSLSFRAARVLPLRKRMDLRIADLESVRHFTSLPWFSAMVVLRDGDILFERYAPDLGTDQPHSIQSITKTLMHLVLGRLVQEGAVDLSRTVAHYVPEIGSGYAAATVQQVLNMDVVNDYSEDFTDPCATYYDHEEAMGWRLPRDPYREQTQRGFLTRITGSDLANRSGIAQYKDANTDVLAWIAERAGTRPLRAFLADIVDAAGLEHALHITADRDGVASFDGGACLTARDLARYFSLFARKGEGVNGERVGNAAFIESALAGGLPLTSPYDDMSHAGWGGQFAIADLDTRRVAVFLSVIESQHALNREYLGPVIDMLQTIVSMHSNHQG
jgi:CubicO group peptidase (beta-lactamase class C family)